MLNPSSSLQRLLDAPVRDGRLVWIGLRTVRRGPVDEVASAWASPEEGLVGDRYGGRAGGKRQITLIGREDLAAAAAFLGLAAVSPAQLRRNLVTEGVNLLALKQRRLAVGEAVLEITGECHPCSRMEEALGPGGYNALRGRGGLTARVIRAGEFRLGDPIVRLDEAGI
ncbi:MOSC domain-containing protein [Phenylobacterium sp. LjRoot225]|uniref:MOSC domain-containing protein n=1 Tax=Phenylobacterium sp. LjRoot225 TaxID=3342285 RepID=UPI003ECDA9B7